MRPVVLAVSVILLAAVAAAAQAVPPFSTARLYPTEAEFTRAIQPYQQAIAANARDARAQYWLGFAYVYGFRQWTSGLAPYAEKYLERALPPLQQAVSLEPGRADAYLALHDAYQLMGDYAKADATIREMFQRTRPAWIRPMTLPPDR